MAGDILGEVVRDVGAEEGFGDVERSEPLALRCRLVDQGRDRPEFLFRGVGLRQRGDAGVAFKIAGVEQVLQPALRRGAAELIGGCRLQGRRRYS
jgi:hypothetical protein